MSNSVRQVIYAAFAWWQSRGNLLESGMMSPMHDTDSLGAVFSFIEDNTLLHQTAPRDSSSSPDEESAVM